MMLLIKAACVVVLALSSGVVGAKRNFRTSNGVRLVGGAGPRGRLQVSSKDSWLTGDAGGVAWRPVCSEGFDDDTAQIMCKLLGYKGGRTYFTPEVAYDANATVTPVSNIHCFLKAAPVGAHHRRLLRGENVDPTAASTAFNAGGDRSTQIIGDDESGHANARSLYEPLSGIINIPDRARYECYFYIGSCEAQGPLAGLECGNRILPPAPPSPPSLPDAPPAPPADSDFIRFVGGASWSLPPWSTMLDVEPNLCPSEELCGSYVRVEVQVDDLEQPGNKFWAPLCATTEALAFDVARITCEQAYDWPSETKPPLGSVGGDPSTTPFFIPQVVTSDPVIAVGDFNPAVVSLWVTVLGGDFDKAKKIQDLDIQVTDTQCEHGAMFAVVCHSIWYGQN